MEAAWAMRAAVFAGALSLCGSVPLRAQQPVPDSGAAAVPVLPTLEVKGRASRPAKYATTDKYDDFFRRQRSGFGTFITREQIEKMNAFHTYEIIRNVPGVRINGFSADPVTTRISFSRCSGGRSNVVVFIDGERLIPQVPIDVQAGRGVTAARRGQGGPLAEMLSRISAPQIEMIEVYRSTAEIPGELNEDACAVVFIWTRWTPTRSAQDTAR
jgi:hypothetical protein